MDRRSLIASGLATVVAVGTSPIVFAAPSSAFERALAAYRRERLAFDGALTDAEGSAACARIDVAFLRLLNTPSRHGGDVATKLDAYMVEYEDCLPDEERLAIIAADARRFAA